MPQKYIPLRAFSLFILCYCSKKKATKFQLRVACKMQLKNKKHVFLFKHSPPFVAHVIKVYTLEMVWLKIFCLNNFLRFARIESVWNVLNIVNIASDKSNLCKKCFLFYLFFINDFLILKTGVKRLDVRKNQRKRGPAFN